MTFLQPELLWALPLVALPVLIHLVNRLRHRAQPWGAMRFLIAASRQSTSQARIRQWIILALRTLAVLALILFLARPISGGWLGWAVATKPDAILVLLDRSASMETLMPGSALSRREEALRQLQNAAASFDGTSQFVLIDSATRIPQTIARASDLPLSPATRTTTTATDGPGLLQASLNWLLENRAGSAELWIVSDLQHSNWNPDDSRWTELAAKIAALPQRIRIRLLALQGTPPANHALSLRSVSRRHHGNASELTLLSEIIETTATPGTTNLTRSTPLTVTVDGSPSQANATLDSTITRWRSTSPIPAGKTTGWGRIDLPADSNPADNTTFFVYGPEPAPRSLVVSQDPDSSRILRLAAGILQRDTNQLADLIPPANAVTTPLDPYSLVLWQAPPPEGPMADRLLRFIQEGGVTILLPPGGLNNTPSRFEGWSWAPPQTTTETNRLRISRWDDADGPLARTDEGIRIPVDQLAFLRRQLPVEPQSKPAAGRTPPTVLAAFDDATPFLLRQTIDRGELLLLSTLPRPDWSTLADGPVLVPLLQRAAQRGNQRLEQTANIPCGELGAADAALTWEPLASIVTSNANPRLHAGVYRHQNRLIALNRPASEDDPELTTPAALATALQPLRTTTSVARDATDPAASGEIWRAFLILMLALLAGESFLTLPAALRNPIPSTPDKPQPQGGPTA